MVQHSLPTKLRVLRAERGWSLSDAEKASGVARETIGDLERGRRHPYDTTLAKLARAYQVDLAELLEARDEEGKAGAPQGSGHEEKPPTKNIDPQALLTRIRDLGAENRRLQKALHEGPTLLNLEQQHALVDKVAQLEGDNAQLQKALRAENKDTLLVRLLEQQRDQWQRRAVDAEAEVKRLRQENGQLRQENEEKTAHLKDLRAALYASPQTQLSKQLQERQ
jgi:transcriptional regulator with XRE-family HTH domain